MAASSEPFDCYKVILICIVEYNICEDGGCCGNKEMCSIVISCL